MRPVPSSHRAALVFATLMLMSMNPRGSCSIAAPAPMPAFAPVLRPEEDAEGVAGLVPLSRGLAEVSLGLRALEEMGVRTSKIRAWEVEYYILSPSGDREHAPN